MRRFTLFLSLLLATVMTTFAQSFEDGLYKIHWAWNGRGYMAFHADYPTEAKLADVTLNGYQNSHFSTTAGEPMSIYWYLITGADSKQYLFNADSGLFLNVSDVAADEAKANVLSETAETPIEIESNSTADYTLYGIANGVRYFLSSGCGQPSKTGHPVRWSTKTADLSDGGTPLQLIPVTDVTIDPTILAVAKEAVGLTAVEPEEPAVKWYRLKETSRNEYMNVASFDPSYEQGAYGMVNIAPYAESNDQIFTMEDAGDGKVYLRTNNNYYLTCGAWNVNVSPDAKEALIFEETTIDGATAYFIHASSQASNGFKIGGVNMGEGVYSDDYYVYCDAPQNLWAYWVLEEATLVEETPVAPSYTVTAEAQDATMGTATVEVVDGVAYFKAVPNEGYKFVDWLFGGEATGQAAEFSFPVEMNMELVAVFEAVVEPEQPGGGVVYSYTLSDTRLTAAELMAATEPVYIAIKNLSNTNPYYFVGNTGAVPYSQPDFDENAVFVWEPTIEGVAGVAYSLRKLDGTYMSSTNAAVYSEKGSAALLAATNPTQANGGFNGDTATEGLIDDESLLVRFVCGGVTGSTWLNVQNGDEGIPTYNSGKGGWTVHYAYKVNVEESILADIDNELLNEAETALSFTGVGYPKNADRVDLQDAIDVYKNLPTAENQAALQNALADYYASENITLPTAGKYYTITAVGPNGKNYYLDYNETELVLVERTEETELPLSAMFKFENFGPNKFRIMANDSIYLVYSHGEGSNISWMTSASQSGIQNKNDIEAIDEMGQITFSKVLPGSNVSSTNKDLFGLLKWESYRGIRLENSEYVNGCLTINATSGDFDASDAPFFKQNDNGNYYTSVLRIEDAVFPSLAASEPVVIDLMNDTWTPALRNGWYSAEYLTKEYSNGTHTIKITDNNSCYIENGAFRLAGSGSKITLPAFDFAVEKIEVVGHETAGASYSTSSMNVFVGTTAVSTACYGSTSTNKFVIAADKQAAGNEYQLKVGADGSKVMFVTAIKVYPVSSLVAPELSTEGGVYSSKVNLTVSTPSASVKGVTKVDYYYTTDGTEPTNYSQKAYSGAIQVTKSCTLKVVAYLTYNDEKVATPVATHNFIISPNVPYKKADEVVAGSYLMVSNGNAATPYVGAADTKAIKTVPVTANGNYIETAAYYGLSFEATTGGFHIKDANGKYLAASKQLTGGGTSAQSIKLLDQPGMTDYCVWNVTIANGEATITNYVDYMGMTATGVILYNSGSKAFEMYEQTMAPMTLAKPVLYVGGEYPSISWTPAVSDEITELKEFTFVCTDGIAINAEAGIPTIKSYEFVAGQAKETSIALSAKTVDGNTVVLSASEAITAYGEYQLLIPAGYFVLDPNGLALNSDNIGAYYVLSAPPATLDIASINPENNTNVTSLKEIVIKFKADGVYSYELPINVYNAQGDSVGYVTPGQDSAYGWDAVVYTFNEEITADGVYTFTLPKGHAWDENNMDIAMNELVLTYTIGTPAQPTVETFEVTAVLFPAPLDPANITEIKAIRVQHNQGAQMEDIPTGWTLTDADGKEIMINVDWGMTTFDDIMVIPAGAIKTPGTYTLTIPAGSFRTDGGKEVEAATFSWTVVGAVVEPEALEITSVSPSNENAVESIKTIDITFNKDIKASSNLYPEDPYPVYLEGAGVFPAAMGAWSINGNVLTITLQNAITDEGVYIVKVAAELFVGTNGETLNGEKEFKIIVNKGVDTSIDGVAADGEQVIYDITGRRIEKITSAGIYIVNGVKVLVK